MTTAATSSSSSSRTPPPTRPSGIPDHIGAFHIGREIGKGSFAVVHKGLQIIKSKDGDAQSPSSSKEIAIKIVTRRKLSPKLLENLQGEIAILKAVSHPNIIALIDCLKTDSHIYLIMDYSSGGDLSQFIRRKGSLSRHCQVTESFAAASSGYAPSPEGGLHTKVIRSFLAQLASAMQFMRVRNIVHRDIKPQVSSTAVLSAKFQLLSLTPASSLLFIHRTSSCNHPLPKLSRPATQQAFLRSR